jgi:hypothetical protein
METIDSTYTNQSSMAAMVIWPNGQMSLYTAGDRDDKRETYIVGWSGCTGGPGRGEHVTTVKVGHHGAATSTPKAMLDKFNPENIVISAGSDYGHPRIDLSLIRSLTFTLSHLYSLTLSHTLSHSLTLSYTLSHSLTLSHTLSYSLTLSHFHSYSLLLSFLYLLLAV